MAIDRTNKDQRCGSMVCTERKRFFRTRGVIVGLFVAVALIVLPGVIIAGLLSLQGLNAPLHGRVTVGPNGEAVKDEFMFLHRALTGDGTITARVVTMTGLITYPPPDNNRIAVGLMPWAKAGIIMKYNLDPGSGYVAMMVTGSHGVRMQYNYIGDAVAHGRGAAPTLPVWLRLTRAGNRIIGYESATGQRWTQVAIVTLGHIPATMQVGLFVTSPHDVSSSEAASRFTSATAVFDHMGLHGQFSKAWQSLDLGAPKGLPRHLYGRVHHVGGQFSVTGSGNIAPLGLGAGWPIERSLMGTVAGIIAVIALVSRFAGDAIQTGSGCEEQEHRSTRVKALAAASLTVGTTGFAVGGLGAIAAVPVSDHLLRASGNTVLPVPLPTELRVMFGTALLVALVSVFSLGLSIVMRRRGAPLMAGIAFVVLPDLLARVNDVPLGAARWLLRVTPAAGFAIQQSLPAYAQATGSNTPHFGYYPLAPWAGLAVAGAYAVAVLGVAAVLFSRAKTRLTRQARRR